MKVLNHERKETARMTSLSDGQYTYIKHDYLTIDTIDTTEKLKFNCYVHVLGNICKGANITVTQGNLTVDGNVGDYANIHMKNDIDKLQLTKDSIPFHLPHFFCVSGNFGNYVKAKSKHGDVITTGNVGNYCFFKSDKGKINVLGNVGHHTTLGGKSISIDNHVGSYASLKTNNGNIYAGSVEETASLKTTGGKIKINTRR